MIIEPPSEAKLALIRRFLKLNGTQALIDSGKFAQDAFWRTAMSDTAGPLAKLTMMQVLEVAVAAYQPHRETWQAEYEHHVNWEFTEEELGEIVAFLEKDVGQHFLEGRWRMGAYIGTNTEALLEQLVTEAAARLKGG